MKKVYKCILCDDFETEVEEYYHFHLTTAFEEGGCSFTCPCDVCREN